MKFHHVETEYFDVQTLSFHSNMGSQQLISIQGNQQLKKNRVDPTISNQQSAISNQQSATSNHNPPKGCCGVSACVCVELHLHGGGGGALNLLADRQHIIGNCRFAYL